MITKIKLHKKAELTTETMVLIALALIFLIIVAFVMTGKIKIFSSALGDCKTKSGLCISSSDCSSKGGSETGFDCGSDKTQVCCMNTCEGAKGTCTTGTSCSSGQEQLYTSACASGQVCCK